MLTNKLRLYFHDNFFVLVLGRISDCSLPHPVVPRGILMFLPSPSCFDIHIVVYLWGLEIKKKKVCSMSQLVHCASVKRFAMLMQLMRTTLAGGLSGYRACVNL